MEQYKALVNDNLQEAVVLLHQHCLTWSEALPPDLIHIQDQVWMDARAHVFMEPFAGGDHSGVVPLQICPWRVQWSVPPLHQFQESPAPSAIQVRTFLRLRKQAPADGCMVCPYLLQFTSHLEVVHFNGMLGIVQSRVILSSQLLGRDNLGTHDMAPAPYKNKMFFRKQFTVGVLC